MRGFRIGLLLCAALAGSGCSGAQGGGESVLRFGLAASPVTLDPRYATDAASTRINELLYRQLVDFDARFRPVPALAEWERLGPTRYRFELGREGRRFHNASRLTARDVKATYDSVLDPETASPHRLSLDMIERVRVVDADTVEFELSRADALFPGRLVVGIMPREPLESGHDFGRRPVGSGPFEFAAWPDQDRLVLERRDDGQRFEFLRVAEPTVRVLKLLRGEIDMMQGDLPPELVRWLAGREDVRVDTERGTTFAYLGFNMDDPVVGRLAVRRAIAHALDRRAIIRYVLGGAARPASALLAPGHWAGHPGLEPIEHDPEKARRLLAEAGYGPERPLRLVYKTSSDPFRVRLATVIQDQLAGVGIDVRLKSYDWGTFYADVKGGRFQMYSLAWVGVKMPDIFRYVFHSESVPPAGANRGRFVSRIADRLIERAEKAQDLERQAVLYRRLQAHLLERLPYVPLWYEDQVFVAREQVQGYRIARDGSYDGLVSVQRVSE